MTGSARQLDLVVVGAGPAGLAAADAAAEIGKTVLIIDQAARAGGQIWRHRDARKLPPRARQVLARVRPPRVSLALGAAVVDAPDANRLVVDIGGRVATIETKAIVLATGALERFLPFPGWTLPGVVGVGAMQALIKSGLGVAGQRVVLAGTGPLLWPVAAQLVHAGARVRLIAEQADRRSVLRFGAGLITLPGTLARAIGFRISTLTVPFRTNSWPLAAEGSGRVERAVMRIGGSERRYACDWLATSAGLMPRTEVGRLLGCRVNHDAIVVDECQATSVPGVWAAGECTGVSGDAAARIEGRIAGLAAVGVGDFPKSLLVRRDRSRTFGQRLSAAFAPRAELRDRVNNRCVICRCEDVRAAAIDPSWTARQAKLWTRIGMGACQGAVCGPACEVLYGWEPTTVRPPIEHPELGGWLREISASEPCD